MSEMVKTPSTCQHPKAVQAARTAYYKAMDQLDEHEAMYYAIQAYIDATDHIVPRDAVDGMISIVEGVQGALQHGTFRAESSGIRLKDTPEWVAFYLMAARAERQS
jgi:hypothetical protein